MINKDELALHAGKGNGNPLQCSCLENPRDGGALMGCRLWGRTESDTTEATVVALRSQGNWRWEGPLGTPLGLVHWKRASSPVEAGTAGYL